MFDFLADIYGLTTALALAENKTVILLPATATGRKKQKTVVQQQPKPKVWGGGWYFPEIFWKGFYHFLPLSPPPDPWVYALNQWVDGGSPPAGFGEKFPHERTTMSLSASPWRSCWKVWPKRQYLWIPRGWELSCSIGKGAHKNLTYPFSFGHL